MNPALATRVAVICCVLVFAFCPTTTHSQTTYKIDSGPTSLDGPVGRDGVFPVSANLPTVILGDYTFNDPVNQQNCVDQGWTSHDLTGQIDTFFHVDDFAGLGGGDFGRLVPIAGNQSLWCGARPETGPPLCEYGCLPGYGSSWDQGWCTAVCLPVTGNVTVAFDLVWDMEPGYDYVAIEFDECDDNWIQFGGGVSVYNGIGSAAASHTITSAQHNGDVRVRLRVISDGAFSDADCFYNSDGAAIVDNLGITDASGTVLATEDFEGEAVGVTASNDWNACLPASFGDFAGLFPGAQAMQEVGTTDCQMSCVWGFFSGSTTNYSCGPGIPGIQSTCDGLHAAQATVMYQNTNVQPSYRQYINNEIWSPWMTFSGPASYTTHLDFDVYRDLTLDALVFYDWRVRTRSVAGGCPDTFWQGDNFVYYGGVDWHRQTVALDPYLGPSPVEIQVALGVIDMCRLWCGLVGTGTCHSHSPMFDNVTVYRKNTQSWVVDAYDLFQDSFPDDGTTTGTVAMNTAKGDDRATIRVTEPEFGIDYLIPGNQFSGPAVFCHVRNLPGKSGAVVSGGPGWPEVPSMSTPQWTVLQMTSLSGYRYQVSLNDGLYEPGDTVSFYFSARDAGGGVSYFSHEIGRTDTELIAQANPMEVTCLPAGGAASSGILYVDAYSGYGAEPYFMTAFEALSLEVDRFDRRAPSTVAQNSLGHQVVDVATQLGAYDVIIWNTGTHAPTTDEDYDALWEWLHLGTTDRSLYLSGDDIAEDLENSSSIAAGNIIANYIYYTVSNTGHMGASEPVSPLVIGESGGIFDDGIGPDTLVALGSVPAMNDFDVLVPDGSAVLQASYSGNSAHGAVISQSSVNSQGANVTIVMAGFSFHHIRDDSPSGGTTLVMDRYEHMRDVLAAFGTIVPIPTGGGDDPNFRTTLAQNVPNPFNPVTTISYSLREPASVQIVIYDVSGARVRTLIDLPQVGAGEHVIDWDGTNDRGARVASGVYFYRMATPDFAQTRKMVLLK